MVVVETRKHLQHIANEFERMCDRMGLKIKVGKSKAFFVKKDQKGSCEMVMMRVVNY